MRRRKGFVQVDMHRVDAEIAGARLAHDRVEIGAVAIEERTGLMNSLSDRRDLAFEQPAGVGIGQHDRGDFGPERRFDRGGIDDAVGAGRHRTHGKADQRGGRRIGAMGRFRHQHHVARGALAARLYRRLDRHHAAQLAMGARLRRHGDRRHARHRHQRAREIIDQSKRALHGGGRLQRMNVGEPRQARHFLVEPRIVFHRA
jgi:hypothetical protein